MAIFARKLNKQLRKSLEERFGEAVPGRSKYGNKKVRLDGILFDSMAESRRYLELLAQQRMGAIHHLSVHPVFDLEVKGDKVTRYIGDFMYYRNDQKIVEDVKGVKTDVYKLKKKLMKSILGIEIKEIRE